MDRVTPEARSRIMALVRPRHGRTTEKRLRALLVQQRIRGWVMDGSSLPGRPDFVFSSEMLAVFVDGCFWHGCPKCQKASKSNVDFWRKKVESNRRRDVRVAHVLRSLGWSVVRIRECDLKLDDRIARIVDNLKKRLSARSLVPGAPGSRPSVAR